MSLKVWDAPPYTMCVSKLVTLIDTHHVLWICAMILAWAVNWRKEHTHMPHVCTLAACIDGKSVEFQFSGDRSFVVCVDLPFQCAWGIRCNNNVNGKHLCSAVCGSAQVWHPFIVRYWLQVLRSSSNVQLAVLRYPCRQCTNMQANFFCSCVFFCQHGDFLYSWNTAYTHTYMVNDIVLPRDMYGMRYGMRANPQSQMFSSWLR